MKNKFLIGGLAALLVLGSAIAVGASKNDTQPDDSIHLEDKQTTMNSGTQKLPEITEGQEIELETEHGQTFYKVETDDNQNASANSNAGSTSISVEEASKIATNKVNGTITKVEKEVEHGRLEYKFEIQSSHGEVDVRVDAETGKITRIDYDDDQYEDDDYKADDNDDKYDDDDDKK
nr:PepSY domain-containing protein [Neobacillus sp. Marseille-Q6967]